MAKVLIVHPDFGRLGGIETYFLKLSPRLHTQHEFFSIAQRPGEKGLSARIARILGDYRRYWSRLSDPAIDVVHVNPSLEPKSFFREALFFLLAKARGKRTLVFFHGWRLRFEQRIDRRQGRLFRLLYGRADAFVVLAASFAGKLRRWGVTQAIHTEVTIISDDVVAGFDLEQALDARLASASRRMLFLGRLMQSKGIAIAIEAMKILQATHPHFELLVAGDGEFAPGARALVRRLGLSNVHFQGVLTGEALYELVRSAHVLCFPTQHDEGFPNTVVEAMAFGLPVVTRPVGGIPDFFETGLHGYLTSSTAPEEFARLLVCATEDPEQYRRMARANHRYAQVHFLASSAAKRLDAIYQSIRHPISTVSTRTQVTAITKSSASAPIIDGSLDHD